ncbi:MAG TPA: hypothetical protein VHI51_13380 [Ktedonobacterales bacterium]|nr:hypothetical protein [Ktedonobacterales bacterium]
MSHAAVRQPRQSTASPETTESAESPTQRDSERSQRAPARSSDLALASAAAQAVRMAPGVVELSPGLYAPVATYGPGERVVGIVIHHSAPEQIVVEVHVALSESACEAAAKDAIVGKDATLETAPGDAERRDPIREIASHIRVAVREAVRSVAPQVFAQVDVFIDDLR